MTVLRVDIINKEFNADEFVPYFYLQILYSHSLVISDARTVEQIFAKQPSWDKDVSMGLLYKDIMGDGFVFTQGNP